ncbi:hypothetical protein [Halobacillus salinus]|uniref:hypothetical protein n=1 Tax=Halobacillus salinus TaxID=192814 RepID=UPI0009A72435|nr:hypothetical protein [Halobacillus salinus]
MKYIMPIVCFFILGFVTNEVLFDRDDGRTDADAFFNVRFVLKEELNGPTEELKDVYDGEEEAALRLYKEENVAMHVSEDFLSSYAFYDLVERAYDNGYTLETGSMTIDKVEPDEGMYEATVEVSYSKEDESGTVNMEADLETNQDGKVTDIEYSTYNELYRAIGV